MSSNYSSKWHSTRSVWSKSLNQNIDILCIFVETIVYLGEDFHVAISEMKKCVHHSLASLDMDKDLDSDNELDSLFIHNIKEMIKLGIHEGKSKEEVVGLIFERIEAIPEPRFTFFEKVSRFFRSWYLNVFVIKKK